MTVVPSGETVYLVIRDDLIGEEYSPVLGAFSSHLAAELWISHRIRTASADENSWSIIRRETYRIDELVIDPPLR